jgi:hypothetical protein
MSLTARQCETAKCPPNQNTLVLFDGQGLSLRITSKTNNKLWLWQYSYNKKRIIYEIFTILCHVLSSIAILYILLTMMSR